MMNTFLKSVSICLCCVIFSASAIAAEFGFTQGVINSPSGAAGLFTGRSASLSSSSKPFMLYLLMDNNIKISNMRFSAHASDYIVSGTTAYTASISVESDALAVTYEVPILETSGFNIYGGGGLGLFQSRYTSNMIETTSTSIVGIGGSITSGNIFDIGIIGTIGGKYDMGKYFVGAELNYVNKSITYSANAGATTNPTMDIGFFTIALTTGMKF